MKRILIVESDEEQSRRLSEAIETRGEYDVSLAMTVREACILIAQQAFDLVLAPAAHIDGARQAFQALQPDLPLAVVASGAGGEVDGSAFGDVRGVVFLEEPDDGLEQILGATDPEAVERAADTPLADRPEPPVVEAQPPSAPEAMAVAEPAETVGADIDVQQLLEGAIGNHQIFGGILTAAGEITAVAGVLSEEEAASIAQHISLTWQDGSSALLQFIRPSDRASDLLLFTRPAAQSTLLTLAAAPDTDVGGLRRAAEELAGQPGSADNRQEGGDSGKLSKGVRVTGTTPALAQAKSFALVIQPRRPLPAAMQAAVTRALPEVAESAGFALHFRQVEPHLVHIVTTCPGDRSGASVAHLYKQGIEGRIAAQFGVPAQLWRRGFYAAESDQPLSDVELKLFVEQ